MRNSQQRHQFILSTLQERQHCSVAELSQATSVSEVTIRKDLQVLEQQQRLYRTYGGASTKNLYTSDRPLQEKELVRADQKRRIAAAALPLIGTHDSLLIGSGTTVYALAQQLTSATHLTVITPALKVALVLLEQPNIEVVQLGGLLRPLSAATYGHAAEAMLAEASCGMLFLGVDGIDLEKGLTITNLPEAKLNQRMMESAEMTVVLADSSKFGKRGLSKICAVEQVQYLITDHDAPAAVVQELEARGVTVLLV